MELNLFSGKSKNQKEAPVHDELDSGSAEKDPVENLVPSSADPNTAEETGSPVPEDKTEDGSPASDSKQDPAEIQSSSKAGDRGQQRAQFETKPVSIDSLIKRGCILIFDSSALSYAGFTPFVQKNVLQIQTADSGFHIPHFTVSSLRGDTQENIRQLLAGNMFSPIGDQTDSGYEDLFIHLTEKKYPNNNTYFIVNHGKNRAAILEAAKASGRRYINLLTIDEDGNLIQRVKSTNKPEQTKQQPGRDTKKERPKKKNGPNPNGFKLCSEPEAIAASQNQPCKEYRSGDTVYDSVGHAIRLGPQQFVNPNAHTYETDAGGLFAKIYEPSILDTTFYEEKAKRMISRKVSFQGLCWPIDLLWDSKGSFVGLLIPSAKGEPLHLAIFKEANLQKNFPNWNKKDLCDLTITILKTIQYLHSMNILMGCINPASIRIAGKDEVYFMDTDNYQVEGFPTLMHNTTFTPPELLGENIYLCSKENENYAVAMLVFMLMLPGKAPYNKKSKQTWNQAIKTGDFPFSYKGIHKNSHLPSAWRFMWSHLTPFKEPFYDTFDKNGKFTKPENRRSVGFWLNTTIRFKKDLEDQYDPESMKLFPRTFKRGKNEKFYKCSVCGVEHPRFYFNNKYFDEFQICNECINKESDVSFTCRICEKTYIYTYETKLFHQRQKKIDSDWHDQKYCRDCKKKTVPCPKCGKETPYFLIKNDRCPDCRSEIYRSVNCANCGQPFDITVGDHDRAARKGHPDPSYCPACRNKTYRRVSCTNCGQPFNITVVDHDQAVRKGRSDPTLCPACRKIHWSETCVDCGRQFDITLPEHEFYKQRGMTDPKRCQKCRDNKRNK